MPAKSSFFRVVRPLFLRAMMWTARRSLALTWPQLLLPLAARTKVCTAAVRLQMPVSSDPTAHDAGRWRWR